MKPTELAQGLYLMFALHPHVAHRLLCFPLTSPGSASPGYTFFFLDGPPCISACLDLALCCVPALLALLALAIQTPVNSKGEMNFLVSPPWSQDPGRLDIAVTPPCRKFLKFDIAN